MKKLLLAFVFLLLSTGTSVYATPFLSDVDGSIVGGLVEITYGGVERTYEVVNRHNNPDDWTQFYEEFNVGGFSSGSGYNFTGYYLGTVVDDSDGGNVNDSADDMAALITYYLGLDYDYIVNQVKSDDDEPGVIIEGTTIDDYTNWYSGTWTLNGGNDETNFYVVKAANEYALYYLSQADSTGNWTTAHLLNGSNNVNDSNNGEPTIPEISHLSANIADVPAPVPEPATLFLFGVGLVGLAGFRRKIEH